MVKWQNRDTVFWLDHKGVGGVVDEDHILEASVYATQVFGIIPLLESAVLSVEPVRNVSFLWVQVVQDHICVRSRTRSKDYDLSY